MLNTSLVMHVSQSGECPIVMEKALRRMFSRLQPQVQALALYSDGSIDVIRHVSTERWFDEHQLGNTSDSSILSEA